MSSRSIAEESIVFNADQAGFEMSGASASLRQGELVILFAQTVKPALADQTRLHGLSAAEVCRFQGYKSRTAAMQFLQGRALLRNLLASYIGVETGQIEVSCEEHVKPVASGLAAGRAVPQFNLSHSGGWIVLGAHRDLPLGIDIECAGPQEIDTLSTMVDLFTPNERACLARCVDQRTKAGLFFQLWSYKEAIMKATGRGFDLAPTAFEVLTHDGAFRTICHAEDQDWHLQQVTLCPGLDCALAVGVA